MSNEITMEHINRLAIGNINSVLDEYETRIAALEAQADFARSVATDKRTGSTVPTNGFDLDAYRKRVEDFIDCRKQAAAVTDSKSYYDTCRTQINAYEHALKLLDA